MKYVGLLVLALGVFAQDGKKDQLARRWQQALKASASKYAATGDWLTYQSMYRWARNLIERAVELDPDREDLKRRLKEDPNLQRDNVAKKVAEAWPKVVDKIEGKEWKEVATRWVNVAGWCEKNGYADDAKEAYRRALEFDSDNEAARKALGHVQLDGVWMSAREKELTEKMRDLTGVEEGEEFGEETEVEKKMGLKMQRRRSKHFVVLSPHWTQEQLKKAVRTMEGALRAGREVLKLPMERGDLPLYVCILKSQEQHENFVDKVASSDEAEKKWQKKLSVNRASR